jgi:putative ATPase
MDLFEKQRAEQLRRVEPLAVRMRPRAFEDLVGQDHLVGEGRLLRRMLAANRLTSALFHGPPGTGKTTLAQLIALHADAQFHEVNAAGIGVREIREILADARTRLETEGRRTILFIDEIHRFNRAQQDVLLHDVEQGIAILLGATTENPFFAVNAPLLSRSQLFELKVLDNRAILLILQRAVGDRERGLGAWNVRLQPDAAEHFAVYSDGDARRALTALEVAVLSQAQTPDPARSVVIDLDVAQESIQRKAIVYDGTGDGHYDAVSALIKSIRGSDPDAAVYWMALMLEAGDDPMFIARRLVIAAAEDVGNADPDGLLIAQAAADATRFIGLPECQLPLAQAAVYLACAPKSNAAARAIWAAREDAREGRTVPVPRHLRGTGYHGAERLRSGVGYQYPHDAPEGIVEQEYLGVDRVYYEPTDRGAEARLRAYLEHVREIVRANKRSGDV